MHRMQYFCAVLLICMCCSAVMAMQAAVAGPAREQACAEKRVSRLSSLMWRSLSCRADASALARVLDGVGTVVRAGRCVRQFSSELPRS